MIAFVNSELSLQLERQRTSWKFTLEDVLAVMCAEVNVEIVFLRESFVAAFKVADPWKL